MPLTVDDFQEEYDRLFKEKSTIDAQKKKELDEIVEAAKNARRVVIERTKTRRAQLTRQLGELNRSIAIWGDQPIPRGGANGKRPTKRKRGPVGAAKTGANPCIMKTCTRSFPTVQGAQTHARKDHNITFVQADYDDLLVEVGKKRGAK